MQVLSAAECGFLLGMGGSDVSLPSASAIVVFKIQDVIIRPLARTSSSGPPGCYSDSLSESEEMGHLVVSMLTSFEGKKR